MNKAEVQTLYTLGNQILNEEASLFYCTDAAEISKRVIYPALVLVGNEFKSKTSRELGELYLFANTLERKISPKTLLITLSQSELFGQFYRSDKEAASNALDSSIEFINIAYEYGKVLSIKITSDMNFVYSVHDSIEDFFATEQPNFI